MRDSNEQLLSLIERAFSHRSMPIVVVPEHHPETEIYSDALKFEGRDWQGLTCDELTRFHDAVHGFTPEAFCYFLPGLLSAGIREHRPDLLMLDSVMRMLDRSPTIDHWDDFFAARWMLLTEREIEATRQWVDWLGRAAPSLLDSTSLARVRETLMLLRQAREEATGRA